MSEPSARPKRIQRKRTKGWRMPENAVYVGRPTKWGNPFAVGLWVWEIEARVRDRAQAVALFREHCDWRTGTDDNASRTAEELRGKDLVCWCPLDQPCHADVLLEWANPESQLSARFWRDNMAEPPEPQVYPQTDHERAISGYCPKSQRVDAPRHSWEFDGDDLYVICCWCGERRDAITGRLIR